MWPLLVLLALVGFLALWIRHWNSFDPITLKPEDFIGECCDTSSLDWKDVPTEKKFAIVGAGFCGLGVASALKKHGIPFDIYEADSKVGGNWNHGVYDNVNIISSKYTTEYKDFPMPKHYGEFPSASQVLQYLTDYCQHFQLLPHIRFNTKVELASPIINKESNDEELWKVDLSSGETLLYKGIIIANGHHWDKRIPTQYPGHFTGEAIHSKDYHNPQQLVGKRVLVVGGGNSACDISVESSRFAKQAHISLRRGYWFLPRTVAGLPIDLLLRPWFPLWMQKLILKTMLKITVGRYENFGLQMPDHDLYEHHPTINSDLLNYLKLGKIIPHKDIKCFNEKLVEFVDGTKEEIDIIIYCTGYRVSLPMLPPGIVEYTGPAPQLVNGIMSPRFKNLYVFGIGQPRWGAGSLITPGANWGLCTIIKTQQKLKMPLGELLLKLKLGRYPVLGNKSPDILIDPHQLFKDMWIGKKFVPKLVYLEPFVQKYLR